VPELESMLAALRGASAVTRMTHVQAVSLGGPGALDLLDLLTSSRLFAREGQMLQTLLLDDEARIFADAFVCADEDTWVLLAEGPTPAELLAALDRVQRTCAPAAQISVTDLLAQHELWSIDGPFSWEVASALLGPEVLGAPYLSFLRSGAVTCFRAGKTGEYGYLLLVPRSVAAATWAELWRVGQPLGLVEANLAALDQCALENWHFTYRALGDRGRAELTPAEMQLRWRIDPKKNFVGAEAVHRRIAAGCRERVTCFVAGRSVAPGQSVHLDDRVVGWVLQAGWSPVRGDWVGWAMIEAALACPGIRRFHVAAAEGPVPIETRSPPLIDNRSLFVDPRKHRYATRAETEFPPLVRR